MRRERISYKGHSTLSQHRGAELAQTTRCAAAQRVSQCAPYFHTTPVCSVLPHHPPGPRENQVPSEVQGARGVWHERLSGGGTVTLRGLREGRGRTWSGSFSQAHKEECISFLLLAVSRASAHQALKAFLCPPTSCCFLALWLSLLIHKFPSSLSPTQPEPHPAG